MGRFLNADGYVFTAMGNGVPDGNMFAYCLNNPGNCIDSSGMKTDFIGISGNFTCGWTVSITFGWAWDGKGNSGWLWSYGGTSGETASVGMFDLGVSLLYQWTDLNTIFDLEGISTTQGGSFGAYAYAGGDNVQTKNVHDGTGRNVGGQVFAGVGAGIDVHMNQTRTSIINRNQMSGYREYLASLEYEKNRFSYDPAYYLMHKDRYEELFSVFIP